LTSSSADLPVTCTHCKTALVLTYQANGPREGRYHWQPWECPACRKTNGIEMAGTIVRVRLHGD